MYETILMPTDGSSHSVRAGEKAAYIAQRFDASVHLLHVIDVERAAGVFSAGGVETQFLEYLSNEAENVLDSTVPALEGVGTVDRTVAEGEPADTILEQADAVDADLIAMGTHGRTGLRRYLIGSVTERVVRRAQAPVLTVRATDRSPVDGGYEDILIPTDGSESAEAAVEHGLEIAERTGARVHSVFVLNESELVGYPDEYASGDLRSRLERTGAAATGEIADRAERRGLETRTEQRIGLPASELLDYAEEAGIDLLAMGTAGQTGPSRFLLGSTTERVIRHADVPVVVVNTREDRPG